MQIEKMASMSSRTGRDLQRYNVQGCRQVVGCIPYRYKKDYHSPSVNGTPVDDLEFLLVSSQKSPRLMFPKGGWEQDESLEEAASRETFEEAGVLGEAESCLGTWYFKSKSIDAFHEGFMLPLFVTEELEDWPERDVRLRVWVSYEEAMERCFHPWMKEAMDVFVSQLTLRQGGEKHQGNAMETEETSTIEEQIVEETVTSEEEEMLMSEEPRIDIVPHQSYAKQGRQIFRDSLIYRSGGDRGTNPRQRRPESTSEGRRAAMECLTDSNHHWVCISTFAEKGRNTRRLGLLKDEPRMGIVIA